MSQLICIGLSYKTASVEIRECIAPTSHKQSLWLEQVATGQLPDITELVVLSTCNRTELYAVCTSDEADQTLARLLECPLPDWRSKIFQFNGQDCVTHLLSVAAGLDSQVIGEPQILGQITEAYQQASEKGAAGAILSALMQQAIHAGKRVRHETELSRGALSISSITARHANQITGSLSRATVLVIGAGKMARSAAESLVKRGVGRLLIANRTREHAEEMAKLWNGEIISFAEIPDALTQADVVIAAASSPHFLICEDDVKRVLSRREGRPLAIFDIALPRNIEPTVGDLSTVHLYNLDDLEAVAETHRAERQNAIPQAEAIVDEEVETFMQWLGSRAIVPVIQQLRAQAETVRQSELEHLIRRLPDLDERDRQLLEDFSQRLINKLFHRPTVRLKAQSTEGHADLYTSVIDDLFGLQVVNQDADAH